jgi:hypothetical protein
MRLWPTRRVWKRIGIAFALLIALALIVNGIFAWRAEWQLRSRLAAIRAAGDPASIAELAPPPIPDDQNAAAIIAKIKPRLAAFSKEYGQFYDTPIGKKYDEASERDEPATKEQIDAIRAILNKYSDVEQAIGKAAACEKFGSRMDFSLSHRAFLEQGLGIVQNARTATRFLSWRNEVLRSDGKHQEAIQNGIESLRLARLHENEPTLVAFLVAVAMRGIASRDLYDSLASGRTAPELHKEIDDELARHDDPQQLATVLKTERAFGADWINSEMIGDLVPIRHVFGWYLKSFQVGVLDTMHEYIQLAGRPWFEARRQFEPSRGKSLSAGHGVLAALLEPALQAAFEANARSLVVARGLRIDNALIAFAEKNGREATGLNELGLPREATIDPYSGQPLKLKHTKSGWIVYSVMSNGVDDGGDFIELKDYGLAPPGFRRTEKPESNPDAGAQGPAE